MIKTYKEYAEIKNTPNSIMKIEDVGLDIISEHWLEKGCEEYEFLKSRGLIEQDSVDKEAIEIINEVVNKGLIFVNTTLYDNTCAFSRIKNIFKTSYNEYDIKYDYFFKCARKVPLNEELNNNIHYFIKNKICNALGLLQGNVRDIYIDVLKFLLLNKATELYYQYKNSNKLNELEKDVKNNGINAMYELFVYYAFYIALQASALWIGPYLTREIKLENNVNLGDMLLSFFHKPMDLLNINENEVTVFHSHDEIEVKIKNDYVDFSLKTNLYKNFLHDHFSNYLKNYHSSVIDSIIKFTNNAVIHCGYPIQINNKYYELFDTTDINNIDLSYIDLDDNTLYHELSNIDLNANTILSNLTAKKYNIKHLVHIIVGLIKKFDDLNIIIFSIADYADSIDLYIANVFKCGTSNNIEKTLKEYIDTIIAYHNKGIDVLNDKSIVEHLINLSCCYIEYSLENSFIECVRQFLHNPECDMITSEKLVFSLSL